MKVDGNLVVDTLRLENYSIARIYVVCNNFCVPKVAEFFGIAIYIYFGDHPPPHFHVRYERYKAALEIGSCRVLDGRVPASVLSKVTRWARENEDLLRARWAEEQNKG